MARFNKFSILLTLWLLFFPCLPNTLTSCIPSYKSFNLYSRLHSGNAGRASNGYSGRSSFTLTVSKKADFKIGFDPSSGLGITIDFW